MVVAAVAVAAVAYYPRIYLTLYVSYWDFLDFLLPLLDYCSAVNHPAW
jgi:hypothetical protein